MDTVRVNNEVGRLKRVLVHRPGPETRRFPHGEFALAFPLRPTSSDFDLDGPRTSTMPSRRSFAPRAPRLSS